MPSYSITTSKNNCSSNLSLAPCSSWIMPPFTKLGKPGNSLRKADTSYFFFLPILPISTRLKNTSQTSKKFALISRQTLLLTTLFDCTDINDFYYKENDYFLAAQAVGTPTSQILNHHVLPNIMAPVIIIFSINIGGVIMSLASLGFLGYGLPPTIPDWGGMLSREGRKFMEQAPWLALWPGLFLTIVVYSFNMFGDAVRDLLDPRLRGGQGSYGTTAKRKRGLLARLINPFNQ